jgi:transcriptional regulator with XRE-family HTH domain
MITPNSIETKSNSEIISELGGRFKEYRLFCNLTQKDVSEQSGVSIFAISQFEKGEARNIGFGTILSLLRSIGFLEEAEKLLPPLPMLPYQIINSKKKERVRHER